MHYLTCTSMTSVDLAHKGVSRAKYCLSVDCGKRRNNVCDGHASGSLHLELGALAA